MRQDEAGRAVGYVLRRPPVQSRLSPSVTCCRCSLTGLLLDSILCGLNYFVEHDSKDLAHS